jgi:hypothetical protein
MELVRSSGSRGMQPWQMINFFFGFGRGVDGIEDGSPFLRIRSNPDISQEIGASRRRISESCFARTTSRWFEESPDAGRV